MRYWLTAAILALGLSASPGGAQEILEPDPAFSPKKVVSIQLKALKRNDTPEPDFGIRQTWAFAHPANRRMTGPLERFTRMIRSPRYKMLLNHRAHEIEALERKSGVAVFAVTVTDKTGEVFGYRWEVRKIDDGENAGAWATTAVSPPMDAGDAT